MRFIGIGYIIFTELNFYVSDEKGYVHSDSLLPLYVGSFNNDETNRNDKEKNRYEK